MKYRNKPIEIEAIQFLNTTKSAWALADFLRKEIRMENVDKEHPILKIETLEGVMTASVGDYIIKGDNGELHICPPDIFKAIYSCSETYIDRMQTEHDDLSEKIRKLNTFMFSDTFKQLSEEDAGLLELQYSTMMVYQKILSIRLKKTEKGPIN